MTNSIKLSHSQNFLKDPLFVQKLIEKTDIGASDLIVEIGPGKGIITRLLAKQAGRVIALEIDARFVEKLRIDCGGLANVQIIAADFLKWPLPNEPYKVFSNIPFNMTTEIVLKLLEDQNPPETSYLIIQDKAAERFVGEPLAKNTQMSILLKPWFEMGVLARIDRRQFVPVPKVDAVLAFLRKRKAPLVESLDKQTFRDFVIYGFNQWQPTILEAFDKVYTPKQRAIIANEFGLKNAKPSDLTINQWLGLFRTFLDYVSLPKKQLVSGAEKRLRFQQGSLKKIHRTRNR